MVLSRPSGQFGGLRFRYHVSGVIIDDVSFAPASLEIIREMAASGPEHEASHFECRLVVARNCGGDPIAGTSERQLGKLEDCIIGGSKGAVWREAGTPASAISRATSLRSPGWSSGARGAYWPKVLANSPESPKTNSFFERKTVQMK